jgi:hypothetical protein
MVLCESSGMVGSIPMRFRHIDYQDVDHLG